jgi:hypothetical protein
VSEDDEIAARGRILTDYMTAMSLLTALESELRKAGERLSKVGSVLTQLTVYGSTLGDDIANLPAAIRVRELVDEYKEAKQKKEVAQGALRQLGVEVK